MTPGATKRVTRTLMFLASATLASGARAEADPPEDTSTDQASAPTPPPAPQEESCESPPPVPKPVERPRCDLVEATPIQYGDNRTACLYFVNVFDEVVGATSNNRQNQDQFIASLKNRRAVRLMDHTIVQSEAGRLSKDGVVVVRAFDSASGEALPIQDIIKDAKLRVTAGDQIQEGQPAGDAIRVPTINLEGAGIGDPVNVELVSEDAVIAQRKAFHRPRSTWYVDYQLATTGFVAGFSDKDDFRATVLPAAIELQYRNYTVLDSRILDVAFGVAPYLSTDEDMAITGFASYLRTGFGGAQVGAGVLIRPLTKEDEDAGRSFTPDMFILISFTDAILQKLKGPDGGLAKL